MTALSYASANVCVFNLFVSLISLCVPFQWKHTHITLIPKTVGTSDHTQFRPISLLSLISKVLERYVVKFSLVVGANV